MNNTLTIGNNKIVFPKDALKLNYSDFKEKYKVFNFGGVGIDRAYKQLTGNDPIETNITKSQKSKVSKEIDN